MPGVLYIVATPIGNLEDMTLRAIRVLKEVDVIAAEDTRHTQSLLKQYDIRTSLTSYHEHNERIKARQLVARLERGENVALVSDAGSPAISDPGFHLVKEAVRANVRVVPVPGPSALPAVLSASGLPIDRFAFEGFLPAKKRERREKLRAVREEARTLVFFEAPHRLKESLNDIQDLLGAREMVLAREVTKVHEEFLRGPIPDVIAQLAKQEIRGEVTLVISGFTGETAPCEEILQAEIRKLQGDGWRVKEIAEVLGEKYSYSKKDIYRLALGK
jgi:16S rRNA (cytidine1402-2'-O)-methyltransferase